MRKGLLSIITGFLVILYAVLFTKWYPNYSLLSQISDVYVYSVLCSRFEDGPFLCSLAQIFTDENRFRLTIGTRYLLFVGISLIGYGVMVFFEHIKPLPIEAAWKTIVESVKGR